MLHIKNPRFVALLLIPILASGLIFSADNTLPTDVTILTQEDFVGRAVYTVGDALRGLTSIKIQQDGSRGTKALVKMRGLSGSENVLVLLDGRPLTHEYDSIVDLTQLPIGMVDRIEVTRGGAAVRYGAQAIGGAINVITVRPDRKGLVADMGTAVGRNGIKNSIGRIFGRANVGDITYVPSLERSGGFSDNEDFEATTHLGNLTRSFKGKGYWGGEYYFREARVGVSNGTPVAFSEWNGRLEQRSSTPYPQKTQESQHIKGFLAYPLIEGSTTYATFTQSVRNNKDRLYRDGVAARDEDNRTSTFDLMHQMSNLEVGLQFRELKRQIFPEDAHYAYDSGTFISGKWKKNRLTLVPGLRLDHHSRTGNFLAPRLAALFAVNDTTLFSATGQLAHRNPNFEELFGSSLGLGNSNLNDEKSVSSDVGVFWTPSRALNIKVTGFIIRKKEVIARDSTSRLVNGGDEKSIGVENEFTIRLGSDDADRMTEFVANATLQKSKRSLPTTSGYVDAAMSPNQLYMLRLDKHIPHAMVFSNEVYFQSEQFERDGKQGLRVPDYFVWNARFAVKILTADLYVAINNISRERYAEAFGQLPLSGGGTTSVLSPQPDRTYFAGVSVRFLN